MGTPAAQKRCDKELADGSVCGRPVGQCIHGYIATRFGSSVALDGVVDPSSEPAEGYDECSEASPSSM